MKKPRIVVIGLCGMSVFMNVAAFPNLGETQTAKTISYEVGGKGFNQALAAKKMDGEVHFISIIGTDETSKICEQTLREKGIIPHLIKKEGNSALAFILINKLGENQVTVHQGITNQLCSSDIEKYEAVIKTADILVLQFEIPINANKKAIEIANKYQIKTIINPAPPHKFSINNIKGNIILTPNEYEARMIFNLSPTEKIEQKIIHNKKGQLENIIITIGKQGCLVLSDEKFLSIPGLKVIARDTTGAGDIFNGVLAYFIAYGKPIIEAAQLANIASGLSVTKYNVLDSIPNKEEIMIYLNKQDK